jgi:soluble lytic murein transglycosylase
MSLAKFRSSGGCGDESQRAQGDPRDPKVDPVDWVERIPFMETRNYVQRVMENLQVYRKLFGGNAPLRKRKRKNADNRSLLSLPLRAVLTVQFTNVGELD